jgi:hypothetical protein
MKRRFFKRVLARLIMEFREGAKNAAYVINNP